MSPLRFWLTWVLGILVALAIVGITTWALIVMPSSPPPNACPPTDAANPWCVK